MVRIMAFGIVSAAVSAAHGRPMRARGRAAAVDDVEHNFTLANLDVRSYEVFAVASVRFWQERRPLIKAFFVHLRDIGSAGFLATSVPSVCREALTELPGIACVAGMHYRYDGALSKERWRILLHFARRGRGLVYAGLDVRFVWPVASLTRFAAQHSADAAFEGSGDGQHLHFTPDLAAVFPTARAIALLEALMVQLRARSLDGLPTYMQDRSLLRYNLMGPAEQDLLADALLSVLYNTTVAIRKFTVASGAALESGVPSMAHNASLPQCTGAGARADGHTRAWQAACASAGILLREDLPRPRPTQIRQGSAGILLKEDLPRPRPSQIRQGPKEVQPAARLAAVQEATLEARGRLLSSAHLRVILLGNGLGMQSSPTACSPSLAHVDQCWDPRLVFALHCLGKHPSCLDVARCRCLTRSAAWCASMRPTLRHRNRTTDTGGANGCGGGGSRQHGGAGLAYAAGGGGALLGDRAAHGVGGRVAAVGHRDRRRSTYARP